MPAKQHRPPPTQEYPPPAYSLPPSLPPLHWLASANAEEVQRAAWVRLSAPKLLKHFTAWGVHNSILVLHLLNHCYYPQGTLEMVV